MSEGPIPDRRLKAAVNSVEVPPFLESRIRAGISGSALRQAKPVRVVFATALASVLGVVFIAYHLGHLRLTVGAQESYIASVSSSMAGLMAVGLTDHIHCAVFRTYPKDPPTTANLIEGIEPRYAGLIPIVRSHVPDTFRLTLAHVCRYQGRNFVHLSLKNDSKILSLLITRKVAGESFSAAHMLPSLIHSGIPMYQTNAQRFEITALETHDYLVYFISDLGKQQNTDLMLALAASVSGFVAKLES